MRNPIKNFLDAMKKIVIILLCGGLLVGTNCFAKPDHAGKGKLKLKLKKKKYLPYGLQKKLHGELPLGWKKKIVRGEVINQSILDQGTIFHQDLYFKKGTQVYQIEDKIFRVQNATNVILDILK